MPRGAWVLGFAISALSLLAPTVTTSPKRVLLSASVLCVAIIVAAVVWLRTLREPPPLKLALADGRILQIEAVTFGTNHQVGRKSSVLQRFGPWLPKSVRDYLTPKLPHAEIQRAKPSLVVWVNALHAATGTNVDCQRIRVEFVDEHGDLFATETSHWFSGNNFWHQGHVFDAYPRTQPRLRLNVTLWSTNVTTSIEIRNPKVHSVAPWVGRPPPQTNSVAGMQIVLKELVVRTNGGPKKYWETPARFREPVFEFRQGDDAVQGWDAPQWTAEDPSGNYGKMLGFHQPVIKYRASFYPAATNFQTTALLARLPAVATASFTSNTTWNTRFPLAQTNLVVFGIFPAGVNVFSGGLPTANPGMSAVRGGAPSGWTGQSRQINPLKVQEWHAHYTPVPTLYVRFPKLPGETRFGARLRDERGRWWLAKPEPQGQRDNIRAYLIELPPDVTTITPEVVQLNPIATEFVVSTPAASRR